MKRICLIVALAVSLGALAGAQDPATSSDRPPGNVNELTLFGIRPGQEKLARAIVRFGEHFHHPSPDEKDLYVWCDARTHLQLSLEVQAGVIQVVTLSRPEGADCNAHLPTAEARTGRGVALGATVARLKQVYGKPFFEGPSSLGGRNVHFVVFNFSWAGTDRPQILESSFDAGDHLVKLTLSAEYY